MVINLSVHSGELFNMAIVNISRTPKKISN